VMAQLPNPTKREVVLLRLENHTFAEISEKLGCSETWAQSVMDKVKEAFEAELAQTEWNSGARERRCRSVWAEFEVPLYDGLPSPTQRCERFTGAGRSRHRGAPEARAKARASQPDAPVRAHISLVRRTS
jgi:hypothetical protein